MTAHERDRTVRVERDRWKAFFDELSRSHDRWLASVRVVEAGQAPRLEARQLPFEGIGSDPAARSISMRLGSLGHVVANPVHVWVLVGTDGAEKAIEIEAADGTRTILEFRSALPAEMVDGIAATPKDG